MEPGPTEGLGWAGTAASVPAGRARDAAASRSWYAAAAETIILSEQSFCSFWGFFALP